MHAMISGRRKLTARPLTEIGLLAWLSQAQAGDILEYYRGFLAADVDARSGCLSGHDRTELVRVRRRAFWASETGRAHLVQRRHGPSDFSYLLVARPYPKTSPVSLSSLLLKQAA